MALHCARADYDEVLALFNRRANMITQMRVWRQGSAQGFTIAAQITVVK